MEIEIWCDVREFEGYYQISSYGRVKSFKRLSSQNHLLKERIIKTYPDVNGYMIADLYKDGKRTHCRVHRLVADAFIPNPRNLDEIDHIDTVKSNNHYKNLRWCTHSENHLNKLTVKLKKQIMTGRKLPKEQVEKMRKKIGVYKDGVLVHIFSSYSDLDKNSKEILGEQLWNVYVRRMINGTMNYYHGYTYKIIEQ